MSAINQYVTMKGFDDVEMFTRQVCLQILGLAADAHKGDAKTFSERMCSLVESADSFLLLYGTTGKPSNSEILGIATELQPSENEKTP